MQTHKNNEWQKHKCIKNTYRTNTQTRSHICMQTNKKYTNNHNAKTHKTINKRIKIYTTMKNKHTYTCIKTQLQIYTQTRFTHTKTQLCKQAQMYKHTKQPNTHKILLKHTIYKKQRYLQQTNMHAHTVHKHTKANAHKQILHNDAKNKTITDT